MPGRGTEQRAKYLTQLGFDTLAAVSAGGNGISPGKQNGIAAATLQGEKQGERDRYR